MIDYYQPQRILCASFLAVAFVLWSLLPEAAVAGSSVPRGVACGAAPFNALPFCDTTLSIADRVADLIARIHDADKPALLTARGWPQGNTTGLPYLGVPSYDWGLNCVHGVQSTCVNGTCPTSFPNPNGMGATWNITNVLEMGRTIGLEARALWLAGAREPSLWSGMPHIGLDCWSPNININRDPRWGRNQEVPSEDPLIAGEYAKAYTSGIQWNAAVDASTIQTAVTLKHWAAYSLDDSDGFTRYDFDAHVSAYDLADTYFRAFRAAVVETDAKGVMCSYNSLNGIPTCASSFLSNKLRGAWNFSGFVTSDTDSVQCIYADHKYTLSPENASCLAIRDGQTDINSGGTYFTYLAGGVAEGLCSMEDVDRALTHMLTVRFELGLFNGNATPTAAGNPFWHIPMSIVNDEASQRHSLFAAQQSVVLLQNRNDVLPLVKGSASPGSPVPSLRVAFIGPSANQSSAMLGNYLGWLCPGGVSDFSCVETPLNAFSRVAAALAADGANISTVYAQGCHHDAEDPALFAAALDVAAHADVVVFVGGLDESLEAEMHDRTSIALPAAQAYLIGNLSVFANTPKALVLFNGGAIAIEAQLPVVDAVVEAWYPGPHGGEAIANVLFGLYNPGGKLPVTVYPASYVDQIDMSDMSMTGGVGRSYRYLNTDAVVPVFPFGFGLSYTTFRWECETGGLHTWSAATDVQCSVKNTGRVDGDDVLQLYVVPPPLEALPVRPKRSLVNFTRVHVAAASTATVAFGVPASLFCFTAANGTRMALPGTYDLVLSNGGADGWTSNATIVFSPPTATPWAVCDQM